MDSNPARETAHVTLSHQITPDAARAFAVLAHGTQLYGHVPFVKHLDDVYMWTIEFSLPPSVRVAAYLHDVLEDTKVTFDELKLLFPQAVVVLVDAVTDRPGKNRKERHEQTYPITRSYPLAVALKLCDHLANVRQSLNLMQIGDKDGKRLLKMYLKEYDEFRAALYREGEWASMWQQLDDLMQQAREYLRA